MPTKQVELFPNTALSHKVGHAVRVCTKSDQIFKSKQIRKISLLFAFVALFATASFAKTNVFKRNVVSEKSLTTVYQKDGITYEVISIESNSFVVYSCTVTASWKNSDGSTSSITVTNNCGNCTSVQQACDGAYKIASIAIP